MAQAIRTLLEQHQSATVSVRTDNALHQQSVIGHVLVSPVAAAANYFC